MSSNKKVQLQTINLDEAKVRFSKVLNYALLSKLGKVPTAKAFANQFNFRAVGISGVTRETARKWLAGQAIPEVAKLIVLVDWLEIDTNQFMSGRAPTMPSNLKSDLVIETINELVGLMDEKTRSMVLITVWALRESQHVQMNKLNLATLKKALLNNLESN